MRRCGEVLRDGMHSRRGGMDSDGFRRDKMGSDGMGRDEVGWVQMG